MITPGYSVVLTSHARPAQLEEAFASCVRAGVRNIIITATGVTREMAFVFEKLRVTFPTLTILTHPDSFTNNDSWLAGVEAAKTEWVSLVHDDDLVLLNYDRLVKIIMASGEGFGMVSAHSHGVANYFDCISPIRGPVSTKVISDRVNKAGELSISPIRGVFKRDDLIEWLSACKDLPKQCYYRNGFVAGNDLMIWIQACEKYQKFFHAHEAGVSYGHHAKSTTVADLSGPNRLKGIYEETRKWYRAKTTPVPRLEIVTIALDAMPSITWHLPVFNRLKIPWHWSIVEGAAMNVLDTKWCQPQQPRLSNDGTTQYLDEIKSHPNISVYRKESWNGKLEMVNAPLPYLKQPATLLEVDADESWTADQLHALVKLFADHPEKDFAMFWCRYFVGHNKILTTRNCYANSPGQDWRRAWRYVPGRVFTSHEPPRMTGDNTGFTHEETEAVGLVFDHYSYCFRKQVEFKQEFYGYSGAIYQWEQLQKNTEWPARLNKFLKWVPANDPAEVGLLT